MEGTEYSTRVDTSMDLPSRETLRAVVDEAHQLASHIYESVLNLEEVLAPVLTPAPLDESVPGNAVQAVPPPRADVTQSILDLHVRQRQVMAKLAQIHSRLDL